MLWLVGALALVVVVAAFVWVLRHRDDAAAPAHHAYETPTVTEPEGGRSALTFGSDRPTDDAPIDQTVPLSRLGGAGWRDGGAAPEGGTTEAYAGTSRSWAEEPGADTSDSPLEHHVEVDATVARSDVAEDRDRRRGGHW